MFLRCEDSSDFYHLDQFRPLPSNLLNFHILNALHAAKTSQIQTEHFIFSGQGSLPVLAVFRKLFKNFISQIEPIWVLNICDEFSVSSVYFLISSQIRLTSFRLKRHGYALKRVKETDFTMYVCVFFLNRQSLLPD